MRRRHSRMGQYIIKQNLFSIRDKFMIKDTEGNPRFLCHGSLLKIRQTFWLELPQALLYLLLRESYLLFFQNLTYMMLKMKK